MKHGLVLGYIFGGPCRQGGRCWQIGQRLYSYFVAALPASPA